MNNVIQVPLDSIKSNPNNPRFIRDNKFKKLVQSIKDFPEMLKIRPIVVNQDMVVLGGNMRLKALKECGYETIDVIQVENLTEDQEKEFIVKDNVGFGEWDFDILANEWDVIKLDEWGLNVAVDLKDIEALEIGNNFEERFENIKNQDSIYPIVPEYDEDQEAFIIVVDNEVDANWLRETLGMQKMSSYKNSEIGKSNVIGFNDFKDAIENRNPQS
jgi:hypothetical protein